MSKLVPHTDAKGRTYSSAQLRALLVPVPKPPFSNNPSAPPPSGSTVPTSAPATTTSASAPTRSSPTPVRAAAKLALEGIDPTPDRCAAFIRTTLLSHSARATGRTGRITLVAEEVKHLLAAANFLLHQQEQDISSKLDKANAAIDVIATSQASTTVKLEELKEELQAISKSPPSHPSALSTEENASAWKTVQSRKRTKPRKAPLVQRLPSTDMLITAGDSKSPILKGLSPKAVV
ncbi:hypothetical protein CF328_g5124, partial [Tilletia controversa]